MDRHRRYRSPSAAATAGSARPQGDADGEPEGDVVGPLPALGERADGRDAAADQAEVERGDRQAAERAVERLAPRWQRRGEDRRPAEGEREVHRHRGRELHAGAGARDHDGAGGAGAGEEVVAARERDDRGRDAGEGGARHSGGDDVAAAHAHDDGARRSELLHVHLARGAGAA